ncbi:MAG TPA: FtsW/RodA/SpoVE family cell cycle protein [Burkholderiales bacterium]|nr:FtsW/RodA/SpoVE family cell cycle protein [Burkholderiales bacterium]
MEWLITLAVIAFLAWQADAFREPEFVRGANDRYQKAVELRVTVVPQAAGTGRVAELCARFSGWLPDAEREICPAETRRSATLRGEIDPSLIESFAAVQDALARSIAAPLKAQLPRVQALESRAREARAESDIQTLVDRLASETRAYREAYGIGLSGTQSVALECAWRYVSGRYHAQANAPEDYRVFALIGIAALLDGDARRAAIAVAPSGKANAWTRAEREAGCGSLGLPREAVVGAAEIVARARASEINAAKSQAAQDLFANAYWIYALWAATGLALLQIGRQASSARRFLPLAAIVWAVVGWITHVHVEWVSDRAVHTSRLLSWGIRWPDFFQIAAAAAAILLLAGFVIHGARKPLERQTPSSRLAYAGFVLFVGLGWWLALDLSASGHAANRFHALYQQIYVFAAFVLLTMLAPLRLKLADRLSRALGHFLLLARPRGTGLLRYVVPWLIYGGTAVLVLVAAAVTHQKQTQFTSELFRLWLILGASWFFFIRGESALSLPAGGIKGALNALAFVSPLFFVLGVPVVGLMLTDDFGPLFVIVYAASIFVGTAFAFAFFDRAGYRPWLAGSVGVLVAGGWVYVMTFALYSLPAPLARIAERLASVRTPFSSTNDQMAIITWFQESAPAQGYGFGGVPWCGELAGATCRGVPKQIQSDYVFTALAGVYGKAAALALVALLALWLVRVVIHHGRASRGTVAADSPALTQQAWLSWIAVCWVGLTLAQLAITVAGNLGWLPLTGITFPFVSFGAWSLLANTFFLALAMSLSRRA